MHRVGPCSTRATRGLSAFAGLLLAAALVPQAHAESALLNGTAGAGPLNASAHLNFRITVLPSLGLATQAGGGMRVQGNSGALTVQRDHSESSEGRAPDTSTQMRPRSRVIDTALPAPTLAGADRITIALP